MFLSYNYISNLRLYIVLKNKIFFNLFLKKILDLIFLTTKLLKLLNIVLSLFLVNKCSNIVIFVSRGSNSVLQAKQSYTSNLDSTY